MGIVCDSKNGLRSISIEPSILKKKKVERYENTIIVDGISIAFDSVTTAEDVYQKIKDKPSEHPYPIDIEGI